MHGQKKANVFSSNSKYFQAIALKDLQRAASPNKLR